MNAWISLMGMGAVTDKITSSLKLNPDKVESAVVAGALKIQNAAKSKAPYRTGNLKRSITQVTSKKDENGVVVQIGTNLDYGAIQEFGGVVKAKGSSGKLVFDGPDGDPVFVDEVTIPARPYLRPAFEQMKDEAAETIKRMLGENFGN